MSQFHLGIPNLTTLYIRLPLFDFEV